MYPRIRIENSAAISISVEIGRAPAVANSVGYEGEGPGWDRVRAPRNVFRVGEQRPLRKSPVYDGCAPSKRVVHRSLLCPLFVTDKDFRYQVLRAEIRWQCEPWLWSRKFDRTKNHRRLCVILVKACSCDGDCGFLSQPFPQTRRFRHNENRRGCNLKISHYFAYTPCDRISGAGASRWQACDPVTAVLFCGCLRCPWGRKSGCQYCCAKRSGWDGFVTTMEQHCSQWHGCLGRKQVSGRQPEGSGAAPKPR